MKKLLIITWVLGLTFMVNAQQTMVTGVISDSLGSPMEQANVMAFNLTDSTVSAFGFTDANGKFSLKLPSNYSYNIKCSFLGFETHEEKFVTDGQPLNFFITLKESSFNLKGVEIVQSFPVIITGDTITYSTDAFTNGQERKLGDVLNKLPGFDVDKNGKVTVQGKAVETVLVDGKKFFDGDTKLAVKNIPADVIEKIDLVTNYNEIEQLKGLDTDENMAINIQLKDGKKDIWFGDIEAGVGVENKYLAHPNVFHYSPKTNINFIGDANNFGQQAFTMQDYFRFSGGLGGLQNGGSSVSLSSDDQGLAMMQNDMSLQSTSSLAAFNINHNPNKKWKLSGFGIVNGLNTKIQSQSVRNYVRNTGEQTEINDSKVDQNLKSTLVKLAAKYKPSATLQMGYEVFIKASNIDNVDNRFSNFNGIPNNINEINTRTPVSIDQRFDLYKTIGSRNVFSFESNWKYKKQQPLYQLLTENKPFDGVMPIENSTKYGLNQSQETVTNNLSSELNYYYLLNPRNHIQITAGMNNLFQDFNSNVKQNLDDGSEKLMDDPFGNNSKYAFMDAYLGVHYKAKLGKLTLSPGLNTHYYQTTFKQNEKETANNKTLLLPDFYSRYAFSKTKNLTFNYSINAQFTDVSNLSQGTIIRDYTSLFTGNSGLRNNWYHNVNMSFMNFSMYHHVNLFFTLGYQKRYEDINESVVYNGINRLSVPTNANVANETFMTLGSFEKKYLKWKYRLGVDLSYSDFQNTIELQENRNKSFSQTYKVSTETNFTKWPNIEVGIESKWSNYSSTAAQQTFITNTPFANVEVVFPKGFLFAAEYIYTDYRSSNNVTNSQYDFLNAALYYRKKGSDWEFKLSGENLLNTEYIRKDSFNDNVISTYQYYVQPRYVLVSAKYDL